MSAFAVLLTAGVLLASQQFCHSPFCFLPSGEKRDCCRRKPMPPHPSSVIYSPSSIHETQKAAFPLERLDRLN